MEKHLTDFIHAMQSDGVGPHNSADIVADDVLKYYQIAGDKSSQKRGSYCLNVDDDFAYGFYYDHKQGQCHTFTSKAKRGATDAEKEECENLLQVVLEHWGALGSTTPDGLRQGFLQREGKLEKKSNGWYLQVEQKTMDMLLSKLPWNLSMIQFSWMKEVLRVEWN